MEKQGKQAEDSFNNVIDFLGSTNPLDFTPENLIDDFTRQALDAAYASTAWMTGVDALKQVTTTKATCSLFNSLSAPPKYGDLMRQVESLRSGAIDNSLSAISDVAASFTEQIGRSIPELDSGKTLSDTVNTGRSAGDQVKTSNSSSVSDILETGKAGMAKAKSVMSKLAGPMKLLDSISDCTAAVGGSDYIGPVDDMLDSTQNLFQKMYMFDDPAQANYGEFNQGSFTSSIPTVPKRAVRNTMKLANMYNKADNNANLSVDVIAKAAKTGEKSTSSLAPNNNDIALEDKRLMTQDETKVEVTAPAVPASPGREAQPQEKIEAPEPAPVPIPQPPPVPVQDPADIAIPFRNFLNEVRISDSGDYGVYDPYDKAFPKFESSATRMIPEGTALAKPGTDPGSTDSAFFKIYVNIRSISQIVGSKPKRVQGVIVQYKYWRLSSDVQVRFSRDFSYGDIFRFGGATAKSTPQLPVDFNYNASFADLSDLAIQSVTLALENIIGTDPIQASEMIAVGLKES